MTPMLRARISHHIQAYINRTHTTIKHKYVGRDVQSDLVFIFDNYLYIMKEVGTVITDPTTHLLRLHLSFKLYNYINMMTFRRSSAPLNTMYK